MAHRGGTVVRSLITCVYLLRADSRGRVQFLGTELPVAANQNSGILANTIYPDAGLGLQGAREGVY